MAEATDLTEATPMPTAGVFRHQMEGLAMSALFAGSFAWLHLASGTPGVDVKVVAVFLIGLIAIPLAIGLPSILLHKLTRSTLGKSGAIAAFVPFAQVAFYGLQAIAIWLVTSEAYALLFPAPLPAV